MYTGKLADYYDIIHQELTDDIPYMLSHANGRVLELGCGSGRLLAPLIDAGFETTGLDNSETMLARAKAKLPQSTRLVCEDMTQFRLEDKFDTIIVSHNTPNHLDHAGLLAMIKSSKAHLVPDGILILDCANPFWFQQFESADDYEFEREFIYDGVSIRQSSKETIDHEANWIQVDWLFENSETEEKIESETLYHLHFPHIIQLLTEENGFQWQALHGDYDKSDFTEESPRMIITARTNA